MTYIIGAPCVDVLDRACLDVCPVDCIEVKEYSIDIAHSDCIDCDLCVEICPIEVLESHASK